MVLGEYGFMVLVMLRGSIRLRTKTVQPPRSVPPRQPRTLEIEPNRGIYSYEESRCNSQCITYSQPPCNEADLVLGSRPVGKRMGDFYSCPGDLSGLCLFLRLFSLNYSAFGRMVSYLLAVFPWSRPSTFTLVCVLAMGMATLCCVSGLV